MSARFLIVLLLVAAVFASIGYWIHKGDSAPPDNSRVIAAKIGGNCIRTNFGLRSRLDGSKTRIYDCVMPSGAERCVTYSDHVVTDSTALARVVFANALGPNSKPACAA